MKKIFRLVISLLGLLGFIAILSSCSAKKKLIRKQKTEIKSTFKALKEALPEATISMEEKERIRVVFKEKPLFDIGSDVVKPEFIPSLARMARVLNQYQSLSVLVMGYTDTSGSAEYNRQLSWRRAENAKSALLENKLENKRAFTWGFGSLNPTASNDTQKGRQENRRTEFVILFSEQR